jgi:hypothetical protein
MCKLCVSATLVKNTTSHEFRPSSQNLSQWGTLTPKLALGAQRDKIDETPSQYESLQNSARSV